MGAVRGLKVYRVRGRYYSIFLNYGSYPNYFGKIILSEIPTDPEKYQEWKRATIAFYVSEEKETLRIAQENLGAHLDNYWDLWGGYYYSKPTRKPPEPNYYIEWIYVIDLDFDVLCVKGQDDPYNDVSYGEKHFRLDNIPRCLFDLPFTTEDNPSADIKTCIHPIMTTIVSKEYCTSYSESGTEPELLELYERCSPGQVSPEFGFGKGRLSAWKLLRLLLLKSFIGRFVKSFDDLSSTRKNLKGNFVFRQLAYGILSLIQASNGIIFQRERNLYHELIGDIEVATPSWEPPDTDIYHLGDILIILESQITDTPTLHASIGKAIQLAGTSDKTAVIFSISNVVLVNICCTSRGTSVSHSDLLPLYPMEMIKNCAVDSDPTIQTLPTEGVLALLHVFSSPHSSPWPKSYPGSLPFEICEKIFRVAEPATQRALEGSCKVFRAISTDFPRIGEWTLVKASGNLEFLAESSESGRVEKVRVEQVDLGEEVPECRLKWEMVVWNGSEKIELELPLFCVHAVNGK